MPRDVVVKVHGFNFEKGEALISPYPEWDKHIPDHFTKLSFTWNSKPSLWESIKNGCYNPYCRAWNLAEDAGKDLSSFLLQNVDDADRVILIGHSLGTRVIDRFFQYYPFIQDIKSLILLHGAAKVEDWKEIYNQYPYLDVLNIYSRYDEVLKGPGATFIPGELFSEVIGYHGMTFIDNFNWKSVEVADVSGFKDHWPSEWDWKLVNRELNKWQN